MATNFARPGTQKKIGVAEAKAKVLDYIQEGLKVREAMSLVERSEETYRSWQKEDPEFKAAVAAIRSAKADERETGRPAVPPFDEFCRDWLKQPLSAHQLRMWDVIEGRPPRDMHPSMGYTPGYPNRVLINVPPDHAKSTTFTVNYSVWLIHKNPDIRIAIMSQGRTMAKRFLGEIKFKLTSPVYREMHMRFAPEGGWKDPDGSWSEDAIYVQGKSGDKDPTVQALGLGGQIYGARLDVIFLDDIITTKNAREIEKQEILINREIESRLPSEQLGGGLLAILGTRVAPMDLYRYLQDVVDGDDEPVWTHLRQPAVLDYGDGNAESWVTLWPERYSGKSLSKRRRDSTWNLVYQQLNVTDDMTFKVAAVNASINGGRFPGPMSPQGKYHRKGGMNGLYVIGGLDPAAVNYTAMMVVGLDRETEKRWVLDGYNVMASSPDQTKKAIKRLTDTYHINEWVIETNAYQKSITLDKELVQFLQSRGCRLTPHYTTAEKYDPDFGVPTMAPLFDSCGVPDEKNPNGRWRKTPDQALIELPSPAQNAWVNELVDQLTTWQPSGMAQHAKTDLVMALWFTHIACDRILRRGRTRQTHVNNPWLSPSARKRQKVISLSAIREERQRLRDQMEGVG